TDGTDGPTDAAGGFADGGSVARMGGRPAALGFLTQNDSNAALVTAGDVLITGPTRTNVMDLAALLVEAPGAGQTA
ncbi:MAG: glycerate kinase, partial [Desulfovibrio sp.]|nr:glycerate kinase [Desulfovibrio sp.]